MTANAPSQPDASPTAQALHLAIGQHRDGRLTEAEDSYRAILQAQPDHPEANHNMGVLALQKKQAAASLPYFLAALEADPAQAQYWLSYIDALLQAGQPETAREVLALARQQGLQGYKAEALALRLEANSQPPKPADADRPDPHEIDALVAMFTAGRLPEAASLAQAMTERFPLHGFGWMALGMVSDQMGRGEEALTFMQQAALLAPGDVQVHSSLGNILNDLGRREEAVASFRRALEINADLAEVHCNLGATLHDMGRQVEAEASYRQSLRINPDLAEAHYNLGNTLKKMERLGEAAESFRQALRIAPGNAVAHNNLGIALHDLGYLNEAETHYRQALLIRPDYADAHYNLSITLNDLFRLDEAEASCRRALQLKPDLAEAYNNLAGIMQKSGRLDDAVALYRQALQLKPDYVAAHSNLIFTLDMMADKDTPFLQQERKRWAALHADHLLQRQPHANIPDPGRRLRIGYVSAEFREHSASKVFGGMLTGYDRTQFEVFAYANFKGSEDRITALFKKNVTFWRNIIGLSDDAVADMIRADRIDILVDLSGHTAANRLLVFARKPAPIQISAWGYVTGTGMRAMDVLFADAVIVPPEDKHYYAEAVRYLPSFLGYFHVDPFPEVNELPALSDGIVTFGSFNRLAKVTEESYRMWAEILLAVPRSRLVLKNPGLNDAATRAGVIGHFANAGIAAERIVLLGRTAWLEHVLAYQQIDIALDPFPHGGGVTALEGLMMGVPVISLRWPTVAGRVSASIMTTMGLPDWIAETQEAYVALAIQKAGDLTALAALRGQLRNIFTSSAIGDQNAYVRAVEREYRQLWREWCASPCTVQ